jgi:hypothetical protein
VCQDLSSLGVVLLCKNSRCYIQRFLLINSLLTDKVYCCS